MGLPHALKVSAFKTLQAIGVHVVRNHFYQPIPDTRRIPENTWTKQSQLVGIDINDARQLTLLGEFHAAYKNEFDNFPVERPASDKTYCLNNGLFGPVDAEIFYCMIRAFRPKVVLEIGSGHSTLLAAQALQKNESETGIGFELTAVEPYPNATLQRGFPGLTRLVSKSVQDVELAEFERLSANDILFIDSSHVLKTGSDVQYEYLEILPRLKPGVLVHFHDIFLPCDYPKTWVLEELRFWNEQYLLQGFLAFNKAFEILWAGSYMSSAHRDRLQATFKSYEPGKTKPGSFWIRRTA